MAEDASLEAEIEIALSDAIKDIVQPRNLLPIYKLWGKKVRDKTEQAFREQSAPYNKGKWKELSPKYKRYKENYNGKRKPKPVGGGRYKLRWEDKMKDSLFYNVSVDGVEFGTTYSVKGKNLGLIHSFGAPRANISPRPFFPINQSGEPLPELEEELIQLAEEYIEGELS